MVSQGTRTAPTCIWVQAGLLSYRLCQRNFDCEHCPLDAALRGMEGALAAGADGHVAVPVKPAIFPPDRVYSSGHNWLQRLTGKGARIRLGLDGFLASFLPEPTRVCWQASPGRLAHGASVCEIDFGESRLPLRLPITACLIECNEALNADPGLIGSAPYGAGWIAELELGGDEQLRQLLSPERAEQHARLDSRLLRRRMALQMLMDAEENESLEGEVLPATDFRQVLGERCFVGMLRELVCAECGC